MDSKKKKKTEILEVWTTLKEKITNSWKDNKVVVYQKVFGPEQLPAEEAIKDYGEYGKYQKIMAELGVNTKGVNQPVREYATYGEVMEGIKKFKEYYQGRVDWELVRKLGLVKSLVENGEVERLTEMIEKGEI